MRRIPHPTSDTEMRQAFQYLTFQTDVITTGTSGYILVAQGVDVAPVWQTIVSTIDHGSIGGLDGDDHAQYHNDTRGDIRYYTKTEHINTSAGAADAGKPIKLNASGYVDATMLSGIYIDHGALSGLGDDDHTIYLLADGTRALTGNLAVDAAVTIDGRDISVDGTKLDGIEALADVTDATNVAAAGAAMSGGAFHDGFSDFIGNEHIDHTTVTLTASTGLTGGGDISANRSFALSHLGIESLTDPGGDRIMFWDDVGAAAVTWLTVSTGLQITTTNLTTKDSEIVHDNLSGYDANKHVDHTSVSISTGVGLSGGGTIASTRTLALDINGLDVDTIVAGDSIAFYDTTGGHCNKTTFANFKTALAIHAEAHSIASHNDTTATGAELETLTDNSIANTLHRHSELVASDGSPDPALSVDASGLVGINQATPAALLTLKNIGNDIAPLGSDLVTNGDFVSDISSWTVGDGGAEWSWDATGKAQHNTTNTSTFYQGISVTNGQLYYVEFTTSGRTAGTLVLTFGAMVGSYSSAGNATYKYGFKATSTGAVNLTFTPTSTWDGKLDDVIVKQITSVSDAVFLLEDSDGTDAIEMRAGGTLNNLLIGADAGRSNVTGSANLAFGKSALYSNITGQENVALGGYTLYSNLTGIYNVAIGTYALRLNVSGNYNIAMGRSALYRNTTANYNLAIGYNALTYNTIGSSNTAIGANALYTNNDGINNTAVGTNSLYWNDDGNNNAAIGRYALNKNSGGDNNVGVGVEALYNITEGNSNIAIGYRAGRYINGGGANQTTLNSVYLGYDTRASADGADNEIVIGYNAIGKGTNTAMIGGSTLTTVFVPALALLERSSDPAEPAEGECIIWMSDGSGKGDDGDIMIASKAAGTTNVGTLFDHSGGAAW